MGAAEILIAGGIAALFASITGGGVTLDKLQIPKFASKRKRFFFLIVAALLLLLGIFYSSLTEAVERSFSLQERKEWKAAEPDDNCGAFEAISRRKGKFAAKAEERLKHAKFKSAVEELSLPLSLPWTEPPSKSEAAARRQLTDNTTESAKRFCTQNGQLFNGERATGVFTTQVKPICERVSGGYVCSVTGNAKCTYEVPNKIRVCPPS